MTKVRQTPWRRWIAAFAGIVMLLRTAVYAVSEVMSIVKSEVEARGTDTDLVLGLAHHRRLSR